MSSLRVAHRLGQSFGGFSRLACWSVSNGIEMSLNLGPEMIVRVLSE